MYDCYPQPSHQLPFDQGVQVNIYLKFNGLCTRTDRSHLAAFCIDRNAIGCYDFVRIGEGTLHSRPANLWTKPTNVLWQQPCARARFLFFHRWMEVGPLKAQKRACALRKPPSPNETKEWTGDDASIPFYLHPTLTTQSVIPPRRQKLVNWVLS